MRITESGSSGGSSGSNSRYYDIVVGNAQAGDTLAICDVLDAGDGDGWKAALATAGAANPPKSVFTRRGIYDLSGGASGPITVPAGVLNVCDGQSETLIVTAKDAAKKGINALDVFGEIRDVGVVLVNPTSVNASGALAVVIVEATGVARRVRVTGSAVATPGNLGAISAAVEIIAGGFTEDTNVLLFPSVGAVVIYAYLVLGTSTLITRLVRPRSEGDDTGVGGAAGIYVHNASHVQIEEAEIIDPLQAGIFVHAEEESHLDVQITDPRVVWRYADTVAGVPRSGVALLAAQVLNTAGTLDSVRVTRGFFDNFSINGTGSVAVQMLATGAGFVSTVKNCEIIGATCRNFDEGAHVEGTGISTVDANGVVDSDVGQCTTGVNNVNDVNFRALGNW